MKINTIESDKRKVLISVISGLLCFFLSPYGIQISWDVITISLPWSIVFPILVSIVYGWKYALIAGLSGGALYPFYLWFNNGYPNLSTTIIYLIIFMLLGLAGKPKILKFIKNPDIRLFVVFLIAVLLFKIYYKYLFSLLLSLNPPFWNRESINYLSPEILNGFFIKESINIFAFIFISNTLIKLAFVRRIFGVSITPEMKNNSKIFLYAIILAVMVLLSYLLLGNTLLYGENELKNEQIQLALFVIFATGLIITRIIIKYSEEEIKSRFELIAAKEKAEESEARYRLISNNTSDSIWVTGADFRFTYLSPSTEKLFGYSLLEWETLDWSIFVHPDFLGTILSTFTIIKSGECQIENPLSVLVRKKDGTEMWIEISANPLFDENGAFLGSVGISRDITERKRAEEALRKSEAKLNALFTSMSEMVVQHELVFDGQGKPINYRITDCNDAYTLITGITRENAVGRLSTEVYGTDAPPYLMEFSSVAQNGEPYHYETYFEPMDKYFSISVISPEKNRFATVTTDITERRKAEKALLMKMHELERFHRLTVGRELTMIELKKEVNSLLNKAGEVNKYMIIE